MRPSASLGTLTRQLSVAGLGSLLLAGWIGALVIGLLGPDLAMAAAIWTGRTTEPLRPELSYPLASQLVGTVVCLGGLHGTRSGGLLANHPSAGLGLATLAAAGVAILPLVTLARLWQLT